jgi:uncharacterized protein YggE
MQRLSGILLAVAVWLVLGGISVAHAAKAPSPPTVSVEADGKVSAKPDMATLTLEVETQAASAAAASKDNTGRTQTLLAALKPALGPEDQLRTLSFRLQPLRAPKDKTQPLEIKGYQAVHRLEVKIKDLERLGPVLDTALTKGASQINGPYWGHSHLEELQRQAAVDALGRARRLAEALAQASGLKIQGVEKISTGVRFLPARAAGEVYMAARAAAAPPIEVGEEDVRAHVQATFRLAP